MTRPVLAIFIATLACALTAIPAQAQRAERSRNVALVPPALPAPEPARTTGLLTAVTLADIANPEAIAADRVTASIGLVTAHRARTELVAEARHLIKDATAAGGNRVAAVDLSTH